MVGLGIHLHFVLKRFWSRHAKCYGTVGSRLLERRHQADRSLLRHPKRPNHWKISGKQGPSVRSANRLAVVLPHAGVRTARTKGSVSVAAQNKGTLESAGWLCARSVRHRFGRAGDRAPSLCRSPHFSSRDQRQRQGRGASDVKFCSVIADGNRRQGLSIISADRLIVLNSIFKNTQGTRPSAGIDFEPDDADQKVTDVRIERSQFLDNAGPGILIAGKRGAVAKVELTGNVFKGNRPIVVKNAHEVLSTDICNNRQIASESAPSQGLNAFTEPMDLVMHQNDCREGQDLRFEAKKNTAKKKKKASKPSG